MRHKDIGYPTVGDRIAQGVVKDYLEPILEPLYSVSSFGYRPGCSAHDALAGCEHNCRNYSWVVDLDIKGFFDNISHEWMMKMVSHHTQEKWVLLYTERWLKAGIQQADGSIAARTEGKPQGGVISPLLANLYLHHAYDRWMDKYFSSNPFERYADDIIVHCNSKAEAEHLLSSIRQRLQVIELELHPEKTKLVYYQNYERKEAHEHNSFTFLSYSFQPRIKANRAVKGHKFMAFDAAICCNAKAYIKEQIRVVFNPRNITLSLEQAAVKLNPKIRGWLNYYCRFNAIIAAKVFEYLNELLQKWFSEKFRIRSKMRTIEKYKNCVQQTPGLFIHWQKGITH